MKTLTAVLVVMAAAGAASGCARVQGAEAEAPALRPVKVWAATPAPPATGVRYAAAVEAYAQIPLSFRSSGYVDVILQRRGADGRLRAAQPGDLVTRGAMLAKIRETEYRERVSQGRAGVAEAEAALQKARLDLERARTLFAAESLTKPELDSAQAAFDAGQAKLAAARADVALANTALRDCALIAPANGILLERRIEAGVLAGSGAVGFVLGDISAVKARFGIPDAMIQSIALGERIDLVVEAIAGARFEGRVTAVAPAADPQSRVFDVDVTIPNQDGRLRPGMIGTVVVRPTSAAASAAAPPLPTAPLTAIVRPKNGAGEYAAFVVERQGDADVARLRPVQLGEVVGNGITITKGLTAGERVIVSGASLLVDGEKVRVVPD
jgi:RND family efflux transporter MFP subunit